MNSFPSTQFVSAHIEKRSMHARGKVDLGFFPANVLALLESKRGAGGLFDAERLAGSKRDTRLIASFLSGCTFVNKSSIPVEVTPESIKIAGVNIDLTKVNP